jgi:hypothetical protein|tara:strand:- start:69 stop:257 length:189 start_codon:yes stop_codon:yes gene_type:complete
MSMLAFIFGILGGLCVVLCIITAAETETLLFSEEFTAMFWLALGAVLVPVSIASSLWGSSAD